MNTLLALSRTRDRRLGTAVGAAVLLTSLAACGSTDTSTATPATSPAGDAAASSAPAPDAGLTGSLTANDQTSNGRTLTVASVDLQGAPQGWIAIHADANGKPGPVIGTQQIQQGQSTDVVVTLDKPVPSGAVYPMLHVDDNTLGTYEFPKVPGADLPVKADGQVVVTKIMLTVA